MKKFFFLSLLFVATQASTQEECNCQSQIMRIDVSESAVSRILNSSDKLDKVLGTVETLMASDAFKEKFNGDYPFEPMGMPANKETCLKEKSEGDPKFADIDCANPLLCADPAISKEVKSEVCLSLPCSMIMGSHNMGKCGPQSMARPTYLHFPEPISLKKMDIKPISLTSDKDTIKACIDIKSLEMSLGVGVEFAKEPNVEYQKLGLSNLNLSLDGTREVCMTAKVNLSSPNPLSEVKIERLNGNFVSDAMITRSLAGAQVTGLTGYSPATLNVLKLTAAPALARQFRSTIEDAVQLSLASTFEKQISEAVKTYSGAGATTSVATASNSIVSEMGVANLSLKKYADLMDCSLLKAEGKPIPATHNCLNQPYALIKGSNLKVKDIPNPERVANLMSEQMNRYEHVTSEILKNQILGFSDRMKTPSLSALYNSRLKPMADRIANYQLQSNLINSVQVVSQIGTGNSLSSFGLAIPEICDEVNPSSHKGKSIPNCPVQAYVDLEEMNDLLDSMYQSGRLCHSGKGDYVPELNNKNEPVRNKDGSPRGTGCFFAIEEDPDGMRCFLNGAPILKYDSATRKYKVDLKTKECFRGGAILGQGKIGGDINFEIGFTPAICGEGDFCLENGDANWSVVPGTARYALKESSWLNGIVRKTIDKQLNKLVSETIKLPLTTNTGPLSMVPLKAEGRIDTGPGYFGACLEFK